MILSHFEAVSKLQKDYDVAGAGVPRGKGRDCFFQLLLSLKSEYLVAGKASLFIVFPELCFGDWSFRC